MQQMHVQFGVYWFFAAQLYSMVSKLFSDTGEPSRYCMQELWHAMLFSTFYRKAGAAGKG